MPLDVADRRGFVAATQADLPEVAVAQAVKGFDLAQHGLGGEDFTGAADVAEAGGYIDRVAIEVTIHLDHVAIGQADLDFGP